ncbi:MAG: prolyl oligopeptidase family serine peptidase, partial [Faecalibacillus sp.]
MNKFRKPLSYLTSAMMILSLSTPVFAAGTGIASGTQKAYVVGDDWGCGVTKTIMTLDKTIDTESVGPSDFAVEQVVNRTEESGGTVSQRTVVDAYTSDKNGNKVATDSKYVTVEMAISPSEGSPIIWSMSAFRNNWANPYELNVSIVEGQNITSGAETINELDVEPVIDVAGDGKICPQLDGFSFGEGYKSLQFTDEYGTISYSLYTPAKDNHKNALVIWNHGIGETGEDVQIDLLGNEVTALGGDEFQSVMDGAYVLVPQRRRGTNVETVYNLAKKLIAENSDIDANRVIVGGCSAGGGATLQMIYAHPEFYAAAYPICPAGAANQTYLDNAEKLKDLPVWFIHAKNDGTVKYSGTETLMKALKDAGVEVHLSAFDDVHDTTGRFKNEDGTPYQYDGHWSWTYFDNNECYDENGVNLWRWMAKQNRNAVVATGTQKAFVVGDDWGCGVTKAIMTLDQTIDPASVAAGDFRVEQVLNGQDENEAVRTILDAYTSDKNGNKVTTNSKYVTVEMAISPSEGSPIVWSMKTWRNNWANPYELHVNIVNGETITSGDKEINTLDVQPKIDVAGDGKICPQLDGFSFGEGYKSLQFTDEYGTISYSLYTPAKDNHKNALVIWNHGIGETGEDVQIDLLGNEVTALGGDEFQSVMDGAYVLVPQRRRGTNVETVYNLAKKLIAENSDIDANRVIVGGCSAGGGATLQMIYAHPEFYAAAYPICPAGAANQTYLDNAEKLKDLPVWFIHAKNDGTVKYSGTETLMKALKDAGVEVHLSAFDDVHDTTGRFKNEDGTPYQYDGHWSWTYFDNNECYDENGVNLWRWMAKQNRNAVVATGTQKAFVVGDDWGCGVTKTIITLDKTIDPASVAAGDFKVEQVLNGQDKKATTRTILDAYTSDKNGNKVNKKSNIITIEMAISPSEG